MISGRFSPKRYQLNKQCVQLVRKGHPWVFRDHLSTAAKNFRNGQWLQLFDSENQTQGFGIYDQSGLIGVRVLKNGSEQPTLDWLKSQVDSALARRESLRKFSNSFRAIHGENDGLPGIVFDVYGDCGVLQTYSPGVDTLGRYIAGYLAKKLSLRNVIWKAPSRRVENTQSGFRILRGEQPGVVRIEEGPLHWRAQLSEGQKSGSFLDLRALRKWLRMQKFHGKRVLNLFSYTGSLGLAAAHAGAKEVWNVDIGKKALEFGQKYHSKAGTRFKWIEADIFEWLPALDSGQKFDLIIVDPPNMMAKRSQSAQALKAYRKLYLKAKEHLAPGGTLIACCCSSKIPRHIFTQEMDRNLREFQRVTALKPEDDHPVGFREGDYLKILVYQSRARSIF